MKDYEVDFPHLHGSVPKNKAYTWKSYLFGGFFPRTGGDIVIATGPHTDYPGTFGVETALTIFRTTAPRCAPLYSIGAVSVALLSTE